MLSLQNTWVQSLVRELRYCKLHGVAKKKKKEYFSKTVSSSGICFFFFFFSVICVNTNEMIYRQK